MSILGWVGLFSIYASIITVCAAVGVQDRPALAPPAPALFDKNLRAFGNPTFAQAANSLGTIVFAYGECSGASLQGEAPLLTDSSTLDSTDGNADVSPFARRCCSRFLQPRR